MPWLTSGSEGAEQVSELSNPEQSVMSALGVNMGANAKREIVQLSTALIISNIIFVSETKPLLQWLKFPRLLLVILTLTVELSRVQSLRISGEQRRTSNVVQFQKQHQHSFQPNASSSMWWASHSECIHIRFHRLRIDSFASHLLTK